MGDDDAATVTVVRVREYDAGRDARAVEDVERRCEVGPTGKPSLFTDLLGDPLCRVRYSPAFLMLVAELVVIRKEGDDGHQREESELAGMIRGCIKTVACGKNLPWNVNHRHDHHSKSLPLFTKVAYILGLRVSPTHRRKGIGLKLVRRMEEWFREKGAEYSYMATEKDNAASISLFTHKCGYSKFRTPSILVHPVFAHNVRVNTRRLTIIELPHSDAESLYRRRFSGTEFFPLDFDSILRNKLNVGTFLAVPAGSYDPGSWPGSDAFLTDPPESWAVLSVWKCKFTLEVRGASRLWRGLARTTALVDRTFPWLRIPSVPDVFRPFGLHFLYGLGGEGPMAVKYIRALCGFAHNLSKELGCGVVATEVGSREPLRLGIPYWRKLSCAEDLWCIKRLGHDNSDGSAGDWSKSQPGLSIFVDPRDF